MWEQNPCAMLIRQIHLALTKNSDNALRKYGLTMSQLVALMLTKYQYCQNLHHLVQCHLKYLLLLKFLFLH